MRLTEFGKAVRTLRMNYDISLKEMATAMHMGSSYLSALEYGERKLSDSHVEAAVQFFSTRAKAEELGQLRAAAASSSEVVSTTGVAPSERNWVAAFARKLKDGQQPPDNVLSWLESRF